MMALVKVKILGNAIVQELSVGTIKEAREALNLAANYSGSVNGEPQDDGFALSDAELITFAPSVKGGQS